MSGNKLFTNTKMENQESIFTNTEFTQNENIEVQKIYSLGNFIILSIITLGFYNLWWIYKEWIFFKQKENASFYPFVRTLFSLFFLGSLFSRIQTFAIEKGYQKSFSINFLFVGYIFLNFLGRLPEPYFLISFFSFLFLIQPYRALNYAKLNSPDIEVIQHKNFTGPQILIILIGLLLWGFVIFGFFVTPDQL